MPTPIATQKMMTSKGIIEIPIYSPSDVADSSLRIQTSHGIGCYDLVPPTASTPLRVMTAKGIKGINMVVPTAPPPLLITDSFTRPNNVNSMGATETGQTWSSFVPQTWGILNNQAYPISPVWDNPVYIEAGRADNIAYQISVPVYDAAMQILWRIVDNSNYFIIEGNAIYKNDHGSWITIRSGTSLGIKSGSTIRIELRGSQHKILVDGVLKYTFTDAFHSTGTKFGISANNTKPRFDNLRIESI